MNEATLFHDQLLATKFFVPSSSHPLIPRPHLTTLLLQGLRRKLTLISAPAGFGKTTLLSAWVQSFPHESSESPLMAWVSLDESDNEPVLFWTYVLTALDNQQPGLCTPLLTYLQAQPAPKPLRYVLQALINNLANKTEQFFLILDDYHIITHPEIHTSLNYLVEHLPPQLHIMLATRADPPLSLSLLRARGEMLEVRTNHLRCTPEEVMAFFKVVMGIQLPGNIVQKVTTRTEGWLVGLQLLGLSLQGDTASDDLLNEVRGSQRYILDYLIEEVLRRQPPSVQTFLLRTSILERFSASLCDAALEQSGSQEVIEFLEHSNVFVVPLDGQRHWYRYHALFADALRTQLEKIEGEAVTDLHTRASYWFARQRYLNEAIRHAMSARNWPLAADLIEEEYTFIWWSSEHALMRRWLEMLPVEVMRSHPRLCLTYAKTLLMVAPYTTMESWLRDAERALRTTVPTPTSENAETGASPSSAQSEWNNLLGEIAAYRALITGYHLGEGHTALAFCEEALAHLSEQNLVARASVAYTQSLAYYSIGDVSASIQCTRKATALAQAAGDISSTITYQCRTAYSLLVSGRLREAVQAAEHAALLGTTSVGLHHAMVCWAYIYLAEVLRQQNRLDEAFAQASQAVRLSEQTETVVVLYFGYTELMRIYLAQGEMEAARSAFLQAEEALAKTYSPYRRAVYVIVEWVQFWLASGALDRAVNWLQEHTQEASIHSPLAREREDIARVRILLAQKKPIEALSLLEPLLVIAQKQERLGHVIEMKVLQALAYQMCKQEQEALSVLAQATRLAEPEGYIRCFVDEGVSMAALLSILREKERMYRPTPYLDAVLAAFRQIRTESESHLEKTGQPMIVPQIDPLSTRELQVLHLMVQGDSNQEIAVTLVLSIDTIKRHVSNIFSKLGVKNRVQAVARARALGLLSNEL